METTTDIIKNIEETLIKIKEVELEFDEKMELLQKELEEKKSNILEKLGFRIGDKVTLELFEYRDDTVHCFQVAQTAECYIHGIRISRAEKVDKFLSPILRKADRKKDIHFNQYLSWDLKKDGKVILSHREKEVIIPGIYTEEKLKELKPRLLEAQKI